MSSCWEGGKSLLPTPGSPGLCIRLTVSGQTMGPGGLGGHLAVAAALPLGHLRPAAAPEKAPRWLGQPPESRTLHTWLPERELLCTPVSAFVKQLTTTYLIDLL